MLAALVVAVRTDTDTALHIEADMDSEPDSAGVCITGNARSQCALGPWVMPVRAAAGCPMCHVGPVLNRSNCAPPNARRRAGLAT